MLLMNLRNVPDEEADEVRALLDEHGIDYYESRPSLLGFASAAIWAHRKEQVAEARELLAEYQQALQQRMRAEHEARVRAGTAETLGSSFRRNPLQVTAALAGVVFLLSLALVPFIMLAD